MASIEQINQASSDSDKWLKARQAKHVKMVEESIKKLQDDILGSLDILKKNPAGKIRGLSVNLGNAQKIHTKIVKLFDKDFSKEMQKVISDFKNNKALITSSFKTIGESVKFTNIDETMMKVLRDGDYQQYLAIGKTARDKVTQQVYDSVIAGGTQTQLATSIRGALLGSAAVSVVGVPLANYARLYARDMIMNYHNGVILTKGESLGMNHFKYMGTLMATSRTFCKRRVGLTYTKAQIQSWKYKWKGKSGPAWTNRGGYNCRHHYQPVRPEWLPEDEQLAIGKQNKINKDGDVKTPWGTKINPIRKAPDVKPKPKQKAPDVVGKGTIPNPPTAKSIERDLAKLRAKPAYTSVEVRRVAMSKEIRDLEKTRDQWLAVEYPKIEPMIQKMAKSSNPGKYKDKLEAMENARWTIIDKIAQAEKKKILLEQQLNQQKSDVVLARITPPAGGKIRYTTSDGMSKLMSNKIAANFKAAEALLHPDVIAKIPEHYVRYKSGLRSYYTAGKSTGWGKRPPSIHLGTGDTRVQVHEFGHGVEYSIPGLQKKAQAFLKQRAGSEPLTKIYAGTAEAGWRDGFYDHYVGKYYTNGATEIISMGLDKMFTSPIDFFRVDPGHFDFILKIMWGTI